MAAHTLINRYIQEFLGDGKKILDQVKGGRKFSQIQDFNSIKVVGPILEKFLMTRSEGFSNSLRSEGYPNGTRTEGYPNGHWTEGFKFSYPSGLRTI